MFILIQQIRTRHKHLASEEFNPTDLSRAKALLGSKSEGQS
jgi:hypothetical protein